MKKLFKFSLVLFGAAAIAVSSIYFFREKKQEISADKTAALVSKSNQQEAVVDATKASDKAQTPVKTNFSQKKNTSIPYFERESGEEGEADKATSIKEAFEENFRRTKDPVLGYPPVERLLTAVEQTRRRQAQLQANGYYDLRGGNSMARFRDRGPNNIGGRTRSILIDRNDPSRKTIWAGSVGGGLWKTTDITAAQPVWIQANDYLANLSIGAIGEDPKDPKILYAGTGEGYPNADAIAGLGVFKSTDGGNSWTLLPSTTNGKFNYTQAIFVHPERNEVYVGTDKGLFRSKDGGNAWVQVLSSNIYDIEYAATSKTIFVTKASTVFRSTTGDSGSWLAATNGIPNTYQRLEITISASNNNIMYAIASENGGSSLVYTSFNGGTNWSAKTRPANTNGGEFTNGQAWYDLDIAVSPVDPNYVIVGGAIIMNSYDGGATWIEIGNYGNPHPDHHVIVFDELNPATVYLGNDGGVWRATNAGNNIKFVEKNNSYNVTQFYACAIHPDSFATYYLGGTQDNGSLQISKPGNSPARNVWGGDGFWAHIDENQPNIQLVSSQNGNYGLSTDGGQSFNGGANVKGSFFTPSDYDSKDNILYTQSNSADFARFKVNTGSVEFIDILGTTISVTTVYADQNTPHRIYIGTGTGRLLRLENAHLGTSVNAELVGSFSGSMSSVDIEDGNPDHILVTLSNYGLANSIYETVNGGTSWVGVEGTSVAASMRLPDMPVRWAVFNPNNNRQAMIATEAGVWTTDLLQADSTVWLPPAPGIGSPIVSTHMLQVRKSDKIVLAATHGRGLLTTDFYANPSAKLEADPVSYLQAPVKFKGEESYNASSYLWNFGDGGSSTLENTTHTYSNLGTFPISLTVNGNLSKNASVIILPDHNLPYTAQGTTYGGNFDNNTEQYAVHTYSGSGWERGKSTIAAKSGTHSGDNAYVVGLTETFYKPNSNSILYLPNFNLSDRTIYEFSFWAKYKIQPGLDGFQVQYSTNRGQDWQILGGDAVAADWHNYKNDGFNAGAFPIGRAYFTGGVNDWVQYKLNISTLGGNENVAFRIVFKSEGTGNYSGVAVDDVEIKKFAGEAITTLIKAEGDGTTSLSDIFINWSTLPEYYCQRFELEQAANGVNFERIATIPATGILTSNVQRYSYKVVGEVKPITYFRIKVISESAALAYNYTFYSPTIIVKRPGAITDGYVNTFGPNPFIDHLTMTFNEVLKDTPLNYELFDDSGKLIAKSSEILNGTNYQLNMPNDLPRGIYMLRMTIGDASTKTYKLSNLR